MLAYASTVEILRCSRFG